MSEQMTHLHIFRRSTMLGGSKFERCSCGRARSLVMSDEASAQAERVAWAARSQAMTEMFSRLYGSPLSSVVSIETARRLFPSEWEGRGV